MNKKGFIATSLIYSFFLVFCATLASYVAINIHNKMLLNKVTDQIREDLNSTKYVTDMPVGSYVKFNVKYTKEGIDNSDLKYNVLYSSAERVTLVSNGIFLTVPDEIDKKNYNAIDDYFLFEEFEVYFPYWYDQDPALCTQQGTYSLLSYADFTNILNTNNIDTIKTLLNVSTKYVILNLKDKNNPKVNYFSYDPIKADQEALKGINAYKDYLTNKLLTTNITDSETVGVRLVFNIYPNIEIKGGDGTELSPYILESRCYKWEIIKALF